MYKRIVGSVAIAMLLSTGAGAAHVQVLEVPYVSLVAPAEVYVGETFTVSIIGDFYGLGLLAGGIQLIYESPLLVDDVELHLDVEPGLSCPGAASCPGDEPGTLSIGWAHFLDYLIAPDSGPTLMATITMTADSCCGDRVLELVDFGQLYGGWFGAGFLNIDTPELFGTSVRVSALPLPLPAGVWLMVGAIGTLVRLVRSKTSDVAASPGRAHAHGSVRPLHAA